MRAGATVLAVLLLACVDPGERGPAGAVAGHARPCWGGTLRLSDESDVDSLDPAIGFNAASVGILHLVFDSLVTYDAGTNLVPALAERWDLSADWRTTTFHLRPGVRFHDGRLVTAEDVRWSLERIFDPLLASPGSAYLGMIDGAQDVLEGRARHVRGIAVLDPATLAITLTEPSPVLLNALAMTFGSIMPRGADRAGGARWTEHLVGTGPFRLVRSEAGRVVELAAHRASWRGGLPYVDRVEVQLAVPSPIAFLRVEAGDQDQVFFANAAAEVLWARREPGWRPFFRMAPDTVTNYLVMNCELAPFDDRRVRQAVAAAIDRDKLVRLQAGAAIAAGGFLPPGSAAYRADFPGRQVHDAPRARRLLASAGYPRGLPDVVPLYVAERSTRVGEAVQADLRAIGIRVELRPVSGSVLWSKLGQRRGTALGLTSWAQDYPDPSDFLEIRFHSKNIADEGSVNDAFYANAEVDRLLDEARLEVDAARRIALYRRVEEIVAADAPYAYLFHPVRASVFSRSLRDFPIHPVWVWDPVAAWKDEPACRQAP